MIKTIFEELVRGFFGALVSIVTRKKEEEPNLIAGKRGPLRNFLESVAMAVLMAVLLKYFALEAYVIPTPSMQPTMMGSPEQGKSDRILVDKIHYLIQEPERFDSAVFRYPARQHQSYVKRIVGVGPETLRIAGGNIYRVSADRKSFEVLRKPERIREQLWREIYPMRMQLQKLSNGLDPYVVPQKNDVFNSRYFRISRGRFDLAADGTWEVTMQGGRARANLGATMATNRYSDGYSLEVAKAYVDQGRDGERTAQGVTDLRLGFGYEAASAPDKLVLELRNNQHGRRYSLEIAKGKAQLVASKPGSGKPLQSEPVDFALGGSTVVPLRFALRDDWLYAWREGEIIARLDVTSLSAHEDIEAGKIEASIQIQGKGKARLHGVTVERDLHYTRSELPADHLIDVPAGHFFMMGDNTLGSADGRDWRELRLGVDAEGYLVDPETNKNARVLWGNLRPKPMAEMPHYDDNPVVTQDGILVFEDTVGQIHKIKLRPPFELDHWGIGRKADTSKKLPELKRYSFVLGGKVFTPKTRAKSFVPRAHIQGRPIARFLRDLFAFEITAWIR